MDFSFGEDSLFSTENFLPSGPRERNYYNILQVDMDSPKAKIREAYIRLKNTYSSQSQALYSLLSEEDARKSLVEIEEAFRTLNDELLRREYDEKLRKSGLLSEQVNSVGGESDPFRETMAFSDPKEDLQKERAEYFKSQRKSEESSWQEVFDGFCEPAPVARPPKPREYPSVRKVAPRALEADVQTKIKALCEDADLGNGELYKSLRELCQVSEKEVQQRTKICLEYILALENNNYARLPALVYIRGFLKSYLQFLGIVDTRPYVEAFTERFNAWQKSKD